MSHPLLRPLEELIALVKKWRNSALTTKDPGFMVLYKSHADDLERVLKESGLAELLEAGQAMRHATYASSMIDAHYKWDRALAKVKGKSA